MKLLSETALVSFEISLKAKKNGFHEDCFNKFDKEGALIGICEYSIQSDEGTLAPTFQQLVDWFIEEHNIHPSYGSNHSGWYWNITKTNGTTIKEQEDHNYYKSHYEALNKAIEEAFKLIE